MYKNAEEAYIHGERPLSKWKKSNILDWIRSERIQLTCSIDLLQKVPEALFKQVFLKKTGCYKTSFYYNETDFFMVDRDKLESITENELLELLDTMQKQNVPGTAEEKWKCAFLEWTGLITDNSSTEHIETGIVKGIWFYRANGKKKKTTANGFRFIEKLDNLTNT